MADLQITHELWVRTKGTRKWARHTQATSIENAKAKMRALGREGNAVRLYGVEKLLLDETEGDRFLPEPKAEQ